MTVKELIGILSTMPPDAIVIYRQFSENVAMIAEQIEEVKTADEWIERNGTYIAAVHFPFTSIETKEPRYVENA